MTICIAKRNDKGEFEVAADNYFTDGYLKFYEPKIKMIDFFCENQSKLEITVLSSGDQAITTYFEDFLSKKFIPLDHKGDMSIFTMNNIKKVYGDFINDCPFASPSDISETNYIIKLNFHREPYQNSLLNKIFGIIGHHISLIDDFEAIGSGREVAYGAYHANPLLSAKEICEIVCKISKGCELKNDH